MMVLSNLQIYFCIFCFGIIFLNQVLQVSSSLQCKGENNENVDWFLLYKIPKIPESTNPLIREGVAYLYMDNKSLSSGWTLSHKDISSNDSIPAYTLAPFYNDKLSQELLWVLYNDQPPNQPAKLNNGHSKGAVIANDNEGFWLIHSVPNFPPEPNTGENLERLKRRKSDDDFQKGNIPIGEYAYPSSGKVNGQSFMCISTNEANFDIIGKQMSYNQVIVYRRNLPENLAQKYNVLVEAAKEIKIKKPPFNNKINLYSSSGLKFTSFAKSSKWQKELYDDFVAPELDTDLYAETWLNGRGRLPSDCNQSRVMNIKSVFLKTANVHFKSTHDHSKWAVSVDDKKKAFWVCVGDINRADTQFDRGGGTVCLNLPEVWKNYKDTVDDVEPCPKPKGFFDRVKSWFG